MCLHALVSHLTANRWPPGLPVARKGGFLMAGSSSPWWRQEEGARSWPWEGSTIYEGTELQAKHPEGTKSHPFTAFFKVAPGWVGPCDVRNALARQRFDPRTFELEEAKYCVSKGYDPFSHSFLPLQVHVNLNTRHLATM